METPHKSYFSNFFLISLVSFFYLGMTSILTGESISDPFAVASVGVITDFDLNGKRASACSAKKVERRSTKKMKSSLGVSLSRKIV